MSTSAFSLQIFLLALEQVQDLGDLILMSVVQDMSLKHKQCWSCV